MTLKIGIISPSLDLNGGGEKLIIKLANNLDKKKYLITFYSPNISHNCFIYLIRKGFEVKNIIVSNKEEDRYSFSIEQYHNQIDFNHLYICNHIQLSKLRLFPKILYAHEEFRLNSDLSFEEPFWDLPEQNIFYTTTLFSKKMNNPRSVNVYDNKFPPNHIFVNSLQTKKKIKELTQNKNISVLYPGTDIKKKIKLKNKKKLDFIILGVLAYHKRYHTTLCLAELNPDINFHFVGRGPEYLNFAEYISRANLSNVLIYNDVSDNYLEKLMSKMDCLINLSINEPFGMNMLEAASRGIPVITYKKAGICEILKKNILTSDLNLVSINKQIKKIKNFNTRKKISKKISIMTNLYTWKNFSKIFEIKIDQLVKEYNIESSTKIKSIIYRVDYPWYCESSFEQIDRLFNSNMPILGRYNSSSEHVIIEHLKQIKNAYINCITFLIDFDYVSYGKTPEFLFDLTFKNIERVLIINELNKFNLKFNFGIKNFQYFQINLQYVLTKISSFNFRSVNNNYQKNVIFLNEFESAKFILENIKYSNNIQFYIPEISCDNKLNNIKKIRITNRIQDFLQTNADCVVLNAFNDYLGSAINLEKKIKFK